MIDESTYDWYNPVDGEYTVIIDSADKEYCIDMKYGYHTYRNTWKKDSDVLENVEKMMPKYLVDLKKIDQANTVWYPMYVNTIGVIMYLAPNQSNELKWYCQAAVPVKPNTSKEVPELTQEELERGIFATPVSTETGNQYLMQQPGKIYIEAAFDEFEKVYGKFHEVYQNLFNQEEE